jgi:pyruvate/2-oxoglutarate dehydrogenase complex dihydrolipoamide acyltransferase (E2) component
MLATNIVVPPMGDSISEGSVAIVLKEAQSHVDEDELILKIDTGKVCLCFH